MGLQQPQEKERETGSPDHLSILSAPGIKLRFMSPFICDINILTPRPLFLSLLQKMEITLVCAALRMNDQTG